MNSDNGQTAVVEEVAAVDEVTGEPKKRKGRAKLTDEQKAARKAERDAKLVIYPRETLEDGTLAKLPAAPEDFNPKLHRALEEDDFAAEDGWLDHQANMLERKVARLRQKAENFRQFGNEDQRKAFKKFTKLSEDLAALRESLIASGMNPEDLLAKLMADKS